MHHTHHNHFYSCVREQIHKGTLGWRAFILKRALPLRRKRKSAVGTRRTAAGAEDAGDAGTGIENKPCPRTGRLSGNQTSDSADLAQPRLPHGSPSLAMLSRNHEEPSGDCLAAATEPGPVVSGFLGFSSSRQ